LDPRLGGKDERSDGGKECGREGRDRAYPGFIMTPPMGRRNNFRDCDIILHMVSCPRCSHYYTYWWGWWGGYGL